MKIGALDRKFSRLTSGINFQHVQLSHTHSTSNTDPYSGHALCVLHLEWTPSLSRSKIYVHSIVFKLEFHTVSRNVL